MYNLMDHPNFEWVQQWTKELQKMVDNGDKLCLPIMGNKADLELEEGEGVGPSIGQGRQAAGSQAPS